MGTERYSDIINLPHHVSVKHPQMSMTERAAQFNPFAALTGYDDAVEETARLTESQAELTESRKAALDEALREILSAETRPQVTIRYFLPDEKKAGGRYVTVTGRIRRAEPLQAVLFMEDGTRIPIEAISDVEREG